MLMKDKHPSLNRHFDQPKQYKKIWCQFDLKTQDKIMINLTMVSENTYVTGLQTPNPHSLVPYRLIVYMIGPQG